MNRILSAAVLVAIGAPGCRGEEPARVAPPDTTAPRGAILAGQIRVSTASSLATAFRRIEAAFERAYPETDVALNLGGSSLLEMQILEGAPMDVFAAADPTSMQGVVASGAARGSPEIFATNRLQIAVPAGNPGGVHGLADLADPSLRVGLCAAGVPCGDLAREALKLADVVAAPDTHEPNVRALLTRIELGELDAGITYRTDVASAAGRVEGIDLPVRASPVARYPIVVIAGGPNPAAARAFVAFVLSPAGRAILVRHGFGPP